MLLIKFFNDSNLSMHINENTDFPWQKSRQLLNAGVNFEGSCNAGTG